MRLIEIAKIKDIYPFIEKIKRDCQPYLQQVDNKPFTKYPIYRGITADGALMFKKKVRLEDRWAMSMTDDTHQFINKEFTKLYGEPFRNAMFVTSDERKTWTYGLPYQVFPIGKLTFLWSTIVGDLWAAMQKVKYKSIDAIDDVLSSYQTTDLKAASASGKEIMIRCKEYYAINHERLLIPAPALPERYEKLLQ